MMKKQAKKERRWIAMCKHSAGDPPEEVYVGTYEEVLVKAGKYWENSGLDFDLSRKDPFYVNEETGYDLEVDVAKEGKHIVSVMHAGGEGPRIDIMKETL